MQSLSSSSRPFLLVDCRNEVTEGEKERRKREREREREGGEESRAVCKLNDVICQEMEIFAKMHALAISPLSVNFSFVVDSRSRKKKKVGEAATRKP